VAAEVACVVGFYNSLSLVDDVVDPRLLGPDSFATVISQTLSAVAPWVALAIGAGVLYGLLGRRWGQSRSIVAGVAIALPFMVEPVAWRVYVGFDQAG
jgi:ABC-type spermidine/putrescine transport system permease subunit II